jgi:hypothetical protein
LGDKIKNDGCYGLFTMGKENWKIIFAVIEGVKRKYRVFVQFIILAGTCRENPNNNKD